jgi:non-ribosomal peptide synthetase component F
MASIGTAENKLVSTILQEYDSVDEDPGLIRPDLLHELFEVQAGLHQDNVALEFAGARVTYAELERRANKLARFIRAAGAGRGQILGILLCRSVEVYVAMLAVLKAGAAYVPMDPEYPPERVAYILRDSGATMLISESEFASQSASGRTTRGAG